MQETEDIVARLEQYRNGMWPVHECLRLADAWTTGVDLDDLPQWRIVVAVLAQEVREAATTIATLRAEVEGLRADAQRLDWLESEYERERQAILNHRMMPDSLFRMNLPITRAAIDAAKADKEGA